ncbi:uncharacterized protein LOC133696512 [Populus nigra]|uniref:uncharacterized protein LOC133696512 n=1 Tax=Populus nigra TaxID=3691 RepID=UPI002B26AF5D|nr:uncharacterized protein LOC133696512 [Populus nigra]
MSSRNPAINKWALDLPAQSSKAIFACDLVQCGYSITSVPVKLDLNQGLKPQVLVAYRISTLSQFLIVPQSAENHLRHLSCLPLEEVDITRLHAQSKVVGTLVNIGGATLLTFAHRREFLSLSICTQCTHPRSFEGEYPQETAYYILGLLAKERGPVFLCASNPLSMVMVAILGSFIFKDKWYVGRYARIKLQTSNHLRKQPGQKEMYGLLIMTWLQEC